MKKTIFVFLILASEISTVAFAETPPPAPYMSSGVMLGGPCRVARDSVLPMPIPGILSNLFPSAAFSVGPGFNAGLGTPTSVGGLSDLALTAATALAQAGSNQPGSTAALGSVGSSIDSFLADSAWCESLQSGIQDYFNIPGVAVPAQDANWLQAVSGSLLSLWQNEPAPQNALSPYDLQVQNLLLSQYATLLGSFEANANLPALGDVAWLGNQLHRFFADQVQLSIDCRIAASTGQMNGNCLPTLDANGQGFATFLADAVAGMAPAVQDYAESMNNWQGYLASLIGGLAWLQANVPQYQAALQWWQNDLAALQADAEYAQYQAYQANNLATYWYYKALERSYQHKWADVEADLDKYNAYEWWVDYWLGQVNAYTALEPQAVSAIQAYQQALQQFQTDQQQWIQLVPTVHIIMDTFAQAIESLHYEFSTTLTPEEGSALEERLSQNDPSILDETTIVNEENCVYSTINQILNPTGKAIACRYNP